MLDPNAMKRLEDWGGPALARKMVRLFLDTSGERVSQVQQGLAGGALDEAERGAHSLKSSAGNLGATEMQRVAASMEELLASADTNAARDLFERFQETHRQTLDALQVLERELS